MHAVTANDLRDNQKSYFDKVANGETLIVSRRNKKNVVVMSEDEYNSLLKIKDTLNSAFLAKLDKGYRDINDGKGISISIDDLENLTL